MAKEMIRRDTEHERSVRYEPFSMIDSLHRQMNRLFEDFARGSLFGLESAARPVGAFAPYVDVTETDNEVHVEAELPGLSEKDIDLTLSADGQELMLRGEKRQEHEEREQGIYRSERMWGSFMRAIELPCSVYQDKVEAKFRNGVLTVDLQKTPDAKRQHTRIPIKKAD